jgi:hypothetical protein
LRRGCLRLGDTVTVLDVSNVYIIVPRKIDQSPIFE